MEVPSFFRRMCEGKQIYNVRKEELERYFPLSSYSISLELYDCLCVGYRGQEKCVEVFRFKKCVKKPLVGGHVVEYRGAEMNVPSLTFFKKEVLRYEDHVSFDRATFILLKNCKKVVRLLQLRNRLQLPTMQGGVSEVIKPHDESSLLTSPHNLADVYLQDFLKTYEQMKELEVPNPEGCMISMMTDIWERLFQEVCTSEKVVEPTYNYWSCILYDDP